MCAARRRRTRKRRKTSKPSFQSPLLMVKAGSSGARKMRAHQWVKISLVTAVLVLTVGMTWMGYRSLYSTNDRYEIVELEITMHGDGVMTPEKVRHYSGVDKGTNLFAFSTTDIRRELMDGVPNIRNVVIRRELPSSLFIDVHEREPVARIDQTRNFIDAEGHVFYKQVHGGAVPVIKGLAELPAPGDVLDIPSVKHAITLIKTCEMAPEYYGKFVRVTGVDVRNPDFLRVYLSKEAPVMAADLDWKQRGLQTQVARKSLVDKLSILVGVVKKAERSGARHGIVNLRHDDPIGSPLPST